MHATGMKYNKLENVRTIKRDSSLMTHPTLVICKSVCKLVSRLKTKN